MVFNQRNEIKQFAQENLKKKIENGNDIKLGISAQKHLLGTHYHAITFLSSIKDVCTRNISISLASDDLLPWSQKWNRFHLWKMIFGCLMKTLFQVDSFLWKNLVALVEATKSHCSTLQSQMTCLACLQVVSEHIKGPHECILKFQIKYKNLVLVHWLAPEASLHSIISMPAKHQNQFVRLNLNTSSFFFFFFWTSFIVTYMSKEVVVMIRMVKTSVFLPTDYLKY